MRLQRRCQQDRRGFVLLAVLWVIVGLASVGIAVALTARDAVGAARNRVDLARARWVSEGCVAVMRAAVDDALADHTRAEATWRTLDEVVSSSSLADSRCTFSIRPAGTALDVNTADAEQLRRLFLAMHIGSATTDSLVDAIQDWRDPDDEPRPSGAERSWYLAQHRIPPRNGPFADLREMARVRGLEHMPGLDSILGVDPGRVALRRASRPVLAALPGFSDELVTHIIEARERDNRPFDLLTLAGSLSPTARDSLAARYAEVVPLVEMDPDAWILIASAHLSGSLVTSTVEVRLSRADQHAGVLSHRSWP